MTDHEHHHPENEGNSTKTPHTDEAKKREDDPKRAPDGEFAPEKGDEHKGDHK